MLLGANSGVVHLCANIVEIAELRAKETFENELLLASYLAAMDALTSIIGVSVFHEFDKRSMQNTDDEHEQASLPTHSLSTDESVRTIIQRLSNKHNTISILKTCNPSSPHFKTAISFLANIIVLCPSKHDDILNNLLFASKLRPVRELWKAVRNSPLWSMICAPPHELQLVIADVPEYATDWNVLCVFAEVLSRELMALGDDELFGASFELTRSDLADLSMIMKVESYFSRKRFCPPDHWIMDAALDTLNFVELAVEASKDTQTTQIPSTKRAVLTASCHEILKNIPFVVPFETRVMIFRRWVQLDKEEYVGYTAGPTAHVTIRRDSIFRDGFDQLNGLKRQLKGRIAISFIDTHGLPEAGIDGGGVFKEFLTSCLKQAFDSSYGLFQTTNNQLLYPSASEYATQDSQLRLMEFLGRIIGKALYEGVLIEAAFANFFLSKWLGRRSYFDDLPGLDQELYNGLLFLKNYAGSVEADLGLNFTVSENEFGVTRNVELIPDGANVPVTNENRIRYVYFTANYKLNTKIARQCQAFFRGLSDLIDPSWLKLFDEKELQILLGGNAVPIDIADLRRNTVYNGVYSHDHPTIEMFWRVVEQMDDAERRMLVQYITSCSRPPLLGFGELQPKLCIRDSGSDEDRLPTASTCVNLLKLPIYKSEATLQRKLQYAIHAEAGFELS
eukprot:jgi/Hompol1/6213/HPOL_002212-RA